MGYTNYWTPKTRSLKPEILTEEFMSDVRKLVDVANQNGIKCKLRETEMSLCIEDEEGFSESFLLDTEKERNSGGMGFTWFCFCKTCGCSFDAVVKCAIEIAVKHDIFCDEWSFDGDYSDEEYVKAVELAKKADVGIYGAMAGRLL